MTTVTAIDSTDPDADLPGRGHASGVAMARMYFGLMAKVIPIWTFLAFAIVVVAVTVGIIMVPGVDFAHHVARFVYAAMDLARPLAALLAVMVLAVPAIVYAAGLVFGQRALMTTGFGED